MLVIVIKCGPIIIVAISFIVKKYSKFLTIFFLEMHKFLTNEVEISATYRASFLDGGTVFFKSITVYEDPFEKYKKRQFGNILLS